MAARRKRLRGGDSAFSWVLTGLSGLGLIVGGFGAGVLLGVVTEEPTVLTGHWAGRSERVALRPAAAEPTSRTSTRVPSDSVKRIEPEAAPAARTLLPPVAAARSGYAVQVGSFSSSEAAQAMKRRLAERGYGSFISAEGRGAARRWRVRVGPYSAKDGAGRAATKLQNGEGLATWLVTLD